MKTFILATLAFLVLSAGAVSVSAQKATRISFKRGSTTAIVTGTLSSYRSHRVFVIRVRRGQTLTTKNAGNSYITVSVEPPPGSTYEQDMAADCHDRNEVSPTAAGDYLISVTECLKADAWKGSFKLRVKVR
ncbi:MAG: hypothetical protein ABJA02_02755 [Acidobacteriota bacterium]